MDQDHLRDEVRVASPDTHRTCEIPRASASARNRADAGWLIFLSRTAERDPDSTDRRSGPTGGAGEAAHGRATGVHRRSWETAVHRVVSLTASGASWHEGQY